MRKRRVCRTSGNTGSFAPNFWVCSATAFIGWAYPCFPYRAAFCIRYIGANICAKSGQTVSLFLQPFNLLYQCKHNGRIGGGDGRGK